MSVGNITKFCGDPAILAIGNKIMNVFKLIILVPSLSYAGMFLDKPTEHNTSYLEARYLNHTTGRFISQDKEQEYTSHYAYGTGRVILLSDPTGLMWEQEIIDAQRIIESKEFVTTKENIARIKSESHRGNNRRGGNRRRGDNEYRRVIEVSHSHAPSYVDDEYRYQQRIRRKIHKNKTGLFGAIKEKAVGLATASKDLAVYTGNKTVDFAVASKDLAVSTGKKVVSTGKRVINAPRNFDDYLTQTFMGGGVNYDAREKDMEAIIKRYKDAGGTFSDSESDSDYEPYVQY